MTASQRRDYLVRCPDRSCEWYGVWLVSKDHAPVNLLWVTCSGRSASQFKPSEDRHARQYGDRYYLPMLACRGSVHS